MLFHKKVTTRKVITSTRTENNKGEQRSSLIFESHL